MPSLVAEATARARREGFSLSCDPAASLLAVLAAACLPGPGCLSLAPGPG